jgi:hypothetical protein
LNSSAAILAPFFSAKNVAEMAWYGATTSALEVAAWLKTEKSASSRLTYRLLFERAYDALRRKYRVEYFFKNIILRKLVFGKYSPNTTAFYSEFPVAEARADAVLVNGHATVFEIKTGHDDFTRALHQSMQYFKCFRFVVFVVEETQIDHAITLLPAQIGILALTKRNSLRCIREAVERTDLLSLEAIFQSLRKSEYTAILSKRGYDIATFSPMERYSRSLELFSQLPTRQVLTEFEHLLRLRYPAQRNVALCNQLPESLHLAAFAYRMRKRDWEAIVSRLDTAFPTR